MEGPERGNPIVIFLKTKKKNITIKIPKNPETNLKHCT